MNIYNILSSKPHNKHYLTRYIKFIAFCSKANLQANVVFESHHICPKSGDLFPQFKSFKKYPWNKVHLTLRQHYVAHLLLWKTYKGKQTQAFKLMSKRCGKSSRLYESARKEHSSMMSKNNPNKDGSFSREVWKASSESRRKKQSKLMSHLNKLHKSKPKEYRHYRCNTCGDELLRLEFMHHNPKQNYYCNAVCRNRKIGELRRGGFYSTPRLLG